MHRRGGLRIAAARAGRRFPVVFEMIARGDVHMTGVAQLEKHLTPENHRDLLRRAVHKTKEEVAEIVASIAPKPDLSTSIRRLPRPAKASESKAPATAGLPALEAPPQPAPPAPSAADEAERAAPPTDAPARPAPSATGEAERAAPSSSLPAAAAPNSVRPEPKARREAIQPRSPDRFSVKFTASKRCTELVQQAKDLMSHKSPNIDAGELTEMAYELLVRELLKKKHGVTDRPRKPKKQEAKKQDQPSKRKRSRYIPAQVKREVWARDGGQCSYVAEDGRRCSSTRLLEYDHIDLKCHGGEETAENLRLRCRAHNQLSAEQALGEAHMALSIQGFLPVPREKLAAPPVAAEDESPPAPNGLGREDTGVLR